MSTIIKDSTLEAVANAIREKTGKTEKLTPVEMATEIANIPSGGGSTDSLAEYISNAEYEYAVPASVTRLQPQAFRSMNRLTKVSFKGDTKIYDASSLFNGCTKLVTADLRGLNTSENSPFNYMFYQCSALKSVDTSELDTSKATNMSYMFSNCTNLLAIDLTNFSTSKVTNITNFAAYCTKLTTLDLTKFDNTSLTTLNAICSGCSSLETIPGFATMDFSKLTAAPSTCFYQCRNLTWEKPYVNNTLTALGTQFFYNCQKLSITKVSSVLKELGNQAFMQCTGLKTLWLPETCKTIGSNAFVGCTALTALYTPLTEAPSGWNASAFPSTVTIHYGVTEEEYDQIIGE